MDRYGSQWNIEYITESKGLTREQRHEYKFKKRYKYKNNTITVNDEKFNVDLVDRKKQTKSFINDPNGKINISKELFKLKPKEMDAVIQHEIGHSKMHYINSSSTVGDKRFASPKYILQLSVQNLINRGEEPTVSNINREANRHFGKDYIKQIKNVDPRFQDTRNKNYTKMIKYTNYLSSSNPMEFEADRYAANRTGKKHIKRAIRHAHKIEKKTYPKNKLRQLNKIRMDNYQRRSKSLDDDFISSSNIYK